MPTILLDEKEDEALDVLSSIESLQQQYDALLQTMSLRPATQRWVQSLFPRGLKLADEIESRFGSLEGKRILELGSAYAADLLAMHARGADCVATDKYDFRYADLRRGLTGLGRFDIVRCDAITRWPFADGSFDIVMALEVIEFIDDLDAFFAEIARVLRPGGFALLNSHVTLKALRRDPIYNLPLTAALPNRWRRWVAEKVFRRGSNFRLSNHNFNSAFKFARHARHAGYDVLPAKFADSPIMQKASRWPLARLWTWFIRYYAYDFVFIVRRPDYCKTGSTVNTSRSLPRATF